MVEGKYRFRKENHIRFLQHQVCGNNPSLLGGLLGGDNS